MFILHRTILDGCLLTKWIITFVRLSRRFSIVGTLVYIQVDIVRLIGFGSSPNIISSRDFSSFWLILFLLLLAHRYLSPLLCPSIKYNIVSVFNWVSSVLVGLVWLEHFTIILVSRFFIKLCSTGWLRHMLKLLRWLIIQVLLLAVTRRLRLFHRTIGLTIESWMVLHVTGRQPHL